MHLFQTLQVLFEKLLLSMVFATSFSPHFARVAVNRTSGPQVQRTAFALSNRFAIRLHCAPPFKQETTGSWGSWEQLVSDSTSRSSGVLNFGNRISKSWLILFKNPDRQGRSTEWPKVFSSSALNR